MMRDRPVEGVDICRGVGLRRFRMREVEKVAQLRQKNLVVRPLPPTTRTLAGDEVIDLRFQYVGHEKE